ncbi:uncharacterized protein Z520_12353 [Fonsecaea multimorphosa CBS 102226]|uniref:Major facilitator superfamily (MFS) profile domain-containing protein n=1 Tax=Fonsecaea multimorphosa CBS 102226 TaxID=1442371 RepID=A0A0D2JNB3_9EURO|nr:uncharacterized protein Z520_12353 [Fonsecaea multimorphosa CBS 102226]KIX91964.1 hypothetical protein Z520_12353 [Fonsecaea multimorphosa CBS 102226]OAL17335.1 hypothetical protein AYO22_11777 [Fonsecaea multimorphosa]
MAEKTFPHELTEIDHDEMVTKKESNPHETITVSDVKGKRHFSAYMVISVVIVLFGSLSYSFSAGVIGTTIGQPSFSKYMGLDNNPNASAILGATASLFYVGGVFGSIFSNVVSDRWGRKASIYTGCIMVLCSGALCAGSVNIAMFIVFRFVAGFGGFMLSMVVPVWILEVAPAEVRGAFAQGHAGVLSLGYLLANYVGVGFYLNLPLTTVNAWRGPQAISCLPPILCLAGLWYIPESPRYLFMKERDSEARGILFKIHKSPGDDFIYSEIEEFQIRKQIELDRMLPSSWLYMIKKPSNRKRMWMTIFIGFGILSNGNIVLSTYCTIIMKSLGFDATKQLLIQAGIFAATISGPFIAILYVEKFRRPTLVATGLTLDLIFLLIFVALFASFVNGTNRAAQITCVALVYMFEVTFNLFIEGPLAYWATEFYPTNLRAKGATIQTVTFACTATLWGQSAPSGITNIGWKFFLCFIAISVVVIIALYFYFPDTQGKTLEEVALLFGDDDLVVVRQSDIQLDSHHRIIAKQQNGEEIVEDVVIKKDA